MLKVSDIDAFATKARKDNDEMNKLRESIVANIMMENISDEFYLSDEHSKAWIELRDSVNVYLEQLCGNSKVTEVIPRGGRKYNYDITVKTEIQSFNIEFKYGAATVNDTPQFVSPMNPSQYLSSSFEEYYYNNYLGELCKLSGQDKPDIEIYSKQVGGNRPDCLVALQDIYYQGCKKSSKYTGNDKSILFYTYANMISKQSIQQFINETELNIAKLTQYLQETQKDKIYMMYKEGKFYKEQVDMDDYIIESCVKEPSKFRYVCKTKSGVELTVLLRWKNGNGIAFPAFQISARKGEVLR
jgi:hypothetical protein